MNYRIWSAISYLGLLCFVSLSFSACSVNGAELFKEEGCIHCHRFKGIGGNMGPDLTAVTERRTENWVETYLKGPRKVNPAARMPPFDHLTGLQVKAIYAYLKE